jgi:hypothetical protein
MDDGYRRTFVHFNYPKVSSNDVVQCGAVFREHFPGVRIALGHLDAHVAVVEDVALVIDRCRTNKVAIVVVAELPGYPDGVSHSHGLRVPVRLLPRHPEVLRLLLYRHTVSLTARGESM